MVTSRTIAIVGGGMLGLGLARRLADANHQVTVFEARRDVGGLASAWRLGDITWDRHYHVTLKSDFHTLELINWLGLSDHMRWSKTKTGCYGDGRLYSISNVIEYLRFPLLSPIEKLRLGLTILAAAYSRDWRSFESRSVEEWLASWSGRTTFDKFWRPLLLSKLGQSYHVTSAAFIWATIQRLYAARRSGLKEELFGYVEGGYAQILDAFATRLSQRGVSIRCSSQVSEIVPTNNSFVVSAGNEDTRFDSVVLTIASPLMAHLPNLIPPTELRCASQHRYLGVICASILLDRKLSDFYVTNLIDTNFPFTGIIEMTALVDPSKFGGRHLIYLPRYSEANDAYWNFDDEELRTRFIEGLERVYPNMPPQAILEFKVSRARHVMPIPMINYSQSLLPHRSERKGLYFANSSQIVNGTLNVNETLALADQAFAAIVDD